MAVQSFNLEHIPAEHPIHVALFKDVENSAYLKQQLLSGNEEFEYAFIDACVIVSTVHALAAAYRAVTDFLNSRIRSRNVHSEIVFALSPNSNIAESFRRFGISDTTTSLLAVKVSVNPSITHDSVVKHLGDVIKGTPVEFSDEVLTGMTDLPRVRKIYKLNTVGPQKKKKGTHINGIDEAEVDEKKELVMSIIGAMALRGWS